MGLYLVSQEEEALGSRESQREAQRNGLEINEEKPTDL